MSIGTVSPVTNAKHILNTLGVFLFQKAATVNTHNDETNYYDILLEKHFLRASLTQY